MISLAFFATLINYLDRQTLSVAAPILRAQFHLSNEAYSHIVFAFLLAYTMMNGVSGFLIDRVGTRIGYALFAGWWSVCSCLHAFVRGAGSLLALRFLLGIGEAGNWPAAAKVVAEWFPPEERAFASGVFNSGSSAGAILAPPVMAVLLLKYGWRTGFAAVGCTGLVWLVFWLLFYRTPAHSGPAAAPQAIGAAVREVLRSRFVWVFTFSKIFIEPVWYFYTFWFPEYLYHGRGFSIASIGRFAWIPYFVAGLGSFFGGLLTRVFLSLGLRIGPARKSAVSVAVAMMLMGVPAVLVRSDASCIACASLAMAGYTVALANMLAMPADVFAEGPVASVYGVASMGSGLGGMVFALVTGWLVDRFSYLPVFFLFGLLPLVGLAAQWLWMGPLEPILRPSTPNSLQEIATP